MKDKIMLVKCRFDGNIEGFVNTKEDFKLWLISHNKGMECFHCGNTKGRLEK